MHPENAADKCHLVHLELLLCHSPHHHHFGTSPSRATATIHKPTNQPEKYNNRENKKPKQTSLFVLAYDFGIELLLIFIIIIILVIDLSNTPESVPITFSFINPQRACAVSLFLVLAILQ